MDVTMLLLVAGAALLALLLSARVLAAPVKAAARAALNTVLGLGALWLLNITTPFTGLSLGVNLFNAAVVGVLGIPGLGLLLLAKWVLT